MREIKFRAWHKKRKKFYEVLHLHIYTIMDKGPWATCRGRNCIEQQDVHIQVQPEDCLIEQFTGLLDKNGKEIYEGDVLSLSYGIPPTTANVEVVWRDCCFYIDGQYCSDHLGENYVDSIEVIGNIHENPELLEAKP